MNSQVTIQLKCVQFQTQIVSTHTLTSPWRWRWVVDRWISESMILNWYSTKLLNNDSTQSSTKNCLSIQRNAKWSTLLFPILSDVPKDRYQVSEGTGFEHMSVWLIWWHHLSSLFIQSLLLLLLLLLLLVFFWLSNHWLVTNRCDAKSVWLHH